MNDSELSAIKSVGFIGLGNMGGRMTRQLIDAGVDVLGFDTIAENIKASGAREAKTAAEVVKECDIILISLPSSKIVEPVLIGVDGVLQQCRKNQIIIDLSTSEPESTRRIHSAFNKKGAEYLDAGISGGAAAAESGNLTLMVGGTKSALDRAHSVLNVLSAKVFHLGGSGAGHTAKLLNNFLNAISLSATAEVMVAAKKAGLDLEVLLEVLNSSSGINFATLNRFPKIIHGDYLKGGLSNTLMLKDIIAYTELISTLGVANFHASGPTAAFGLARQLGYADEISNTVVDAVGDISGGVRLHTLDSVTSGHKPTQEEDAS